MSKIWDALREAERLKKQRVEVEDIENYLDAIRDRRSTKRFLANAPVLVYGYGATDDPFHERTEALSVNGDAGDSGWLDMWFSRKYPEYVEGVGMSAEVRVSQELLDKNIQGAIELVSWLAGELRKRELATMKSREPQ